MRDSEVEDLTGFVRRYCAVETSTDEEITSGYFGFYQGKNARSARKARAPVPFGPVERATAEVLRRARELTGNGEGHVWVRAYATGETAPMEAVRLNGSLDEAPDEIEPSGSAIGDLVAGMVRTNAMLLDDNRDLRRLVLRDADERAEERERFAMMTFHAHALEHGLHDHRMQQALAALAPTVEKLGPHVISAVSAWLTGGGGLPETPGPRIEEGVRRLVMLAQDIGRTVQAHPTEATTERLAPLLELMKQLAPALGLQIVPAGTTAAAPGAA